MHGVDLAAKIPQVAYVLTVSRGGEVLGAEARYGTPSRRHHGGFRRRTKGQP
jgi:hypothetical protein